MWSTPYTVALEVFSPLPNMVVLQFCGIKDGSLRNWAVHGGSFARIIWRTKPSPCLQFTMWPLAFLVLKAGISGWFQLCVGSICLENSHTLQFSTSHHQILQVEPSVWLQNYFGEALFWSIVLFLGAKGNILIMPANISMMGVFCLKHFFPKKTKPASQEVLANARVDQREMSLKLLELMTRMFAEEVGWELGWLEVGLLKMSKL